MVVNEYIDQSPKLKDRNMKCVLNSFQLYNVTVLYLIDVINMYEYYWSGQTLIVCIPPGVHIHPAGPREGGRLGAGGAAAKYTYP